MPDKNGRFRGIVVPELPWKKIRDRIIHVGLDPDDDGPSVGKTRRQYTMTGSGEIVEVDGPPLRETR